MTENDHRPITQPSREPHGYQPAWRCEECGTVWDDHPERCPECGGESFQAIERWSG